MLTKQDSIELGVPPALRDRYVVRCIEVKSGPNSKGNPMITSNWEVVGAPNKTGSVETTITRGVKQYQVAGLRTQPIWQTLVAGQALSAYIKFWEAAHPGQEFEGVNPENPDTAFYDGLLMEVILTTIENVQRRELTDDEKLEKRAKNLPLLGEPILDGEGKEMKNQQVKIAEFLKKYDGDVPA
jgi:hypothetical protein